MQNNGTMYLRLYSNEIFYPEEVFPFEYEGMEFFASENKGEWAVTEKKTGFRIGRYGNTQEDAVNAAKGTIIFQTPKLARKCIRETLKNIKAGLVYDSDAKEWREPIEQVL
jgi:predicted metal-dependent RNase